jgi:Zn-dependent protease
VWVEEGGMDAELRSVILSLNLLVGGFNLLPVAPLDGGWRPLLVLPSDAAARYFRIPRSPALRIIGLLLILRGLGVRLAGRGGLCIASPCSLRFIPP